MAKHLLQRSAIRVFIGAITGTSLCFIGGNAAADSARKFTVFAGFSRERVLAVSRPAPSSADFSLRPVFAIKRVPPPPPQPVIDETEELSVEAGADVVR